MRQNSKSLKYRINKQVYRSRMSDCIIVIASFYCMIRKSMRDADEKSNRDQYKSKAEIAI